MTAALALEGAAAASGLPASGQRRRLCVRRTRRGVPAAGRAAPGGGRCTAPRPTCQTRRAAAALPAGRAGPRGRPSLQAGSGEQGQAASRRRVTLAAPASLDSAGERHQQEPGHRHLHYSKCRAKPAGLALLACLAVLRQPVSCKEHRLCSFGVLSVIIVVGLQAWSNSRGNAASSQQSS